MSKPQNYSISKTFACRKNKTTKCWRWNQRQKQKTIEGKGLQTL